ncbi:thioredoxin family protein [Bacillus thuringiensis]|uniref:thioredoxin family protein n=1 Tax=Bacillus thuringiensis TaxID=1428 RepID=UPI000BF33E07|nr:thioredoxin family protein [Bacillus thuringiensis]PEV27762.1 bacteriocin [Bacillus thuringiensis]PEW44199.1 bacteriocin [Bacillus thuringiensis]PEY65826.1 bacteriocin [Bacillus thuringiensis]PFA02545.1 bacteriocin [Bacillus thuringiensis]PFK15106.1 bacteriocin [Bacillus thuringiensis]
MKKYGVLGVIIIIFLLSIFFLYRENTVLKRNNSTLEIEKQIVIDNTGSYDYLNSITVDSFEKRIKNGDDIFVYIGNSQCSDCSFFSKILEKEVKTFPLKDSLYLVNISNIHQDKNRWLAFKKKYGFDQTPAFLLFQQGKVKSMIQWDEKNGLSEEIFHNWLEENETFIRKLEMK